MAEPSDTTKAGYKQAISDFWRGTPTTEIGNDLLQTDNKKKGKSSGEIAASFAASVSKNADEQGLYKANKGLWRDVINNRLVAAGLNISDANGVVAAMENLESDSPFINWIIEFVYTIGTGLKLFNSYWDVVGQAINKANTKKAKLSTGDFDSLWTYLQKNGLQSLYNELIPELGLNANWQTVMQDSRKLVITPDVTGELFRRGILDPELAMSYMYQNGYWSKQQQAWMLEAAKPLLPTDTGLELWRRGELKDAAMAQVLSKRGFDDTMIPQIMEAAIPLMGTSEIVPLYQKKYMGQTEAIKRLAKLGYKEEDLAYLLSLAKQPLDPNTLLRMVWRGVISTQEYVTTLTKLGLEESDANRMSKIIWQPPSPVDMIRFAVREVYTPDIAKKFGQYEDFPEAFAVEAAKVGISRETAQQHWAAHWDLPAPEQGFDMYHRGIINHDELKMLLRALDVMPFWSDRLIQLQDQLITRRQLRELLRTGVETTREVKERYVKLGFSDIDATTLVNLDWATIFEAEKDVTKNDAVKAFVAHLIDETELRGLLQPLNYSSEAIDFYVNDAKRQQYVTDTTAQLTPNDKAEQDAKANLTKDIITEYQTGMIPFDTAVEMLVGLGYYAETAQFFLAHADLQSMKADLNYYAAQIKRMFDVSAIDATEAKRQLTEKGYDVNAALKLVAKWDYEKYADTQVAKTKVTNPTKAEFKKWVKLGIASVEEYNSYLAEQGYDEYSRINYITELMIDIDSGATV